MAALGSETMHSLARNVITAALIIAGVIHLLPVTGALGVPRLDTLYGTSIDDPNLAILMRHRAVLFGLLGLFLVCAAFRPSLQVPALAAGFVSVVSFLWLAYSTGGYNGQMARVVVADVVALACLVIALAARVYSGSGHNGHA